MNLKEIEATGNFLAYYYTDLIYIEKFQDYKNNSLSKNEYISKEKGTFYSFLIEFKVVRNFNKGEVNKLLELTNNFVNGISPIDVDLFAEILLDSNLTRGKLMTSLASKILFLNNPWQIIPMDTLARKSLNQKDNKYETYIRNLQLFRKKNTEIINNCMKFTHPLTQTINKKFENKINNLELITENRILDKLLWTSGK